MSNKSTLHFRDNFSGKSDEYQQFRPHYPDTLFEYLASKSNQQHAAWDCATGNGQSAICLADHFDTVIGTDACEEQIRNTTQKSGVSYHVATAEKSNLESNSIDLITVAQAFHWFSTDAFFSEADRVLRKDGLIAIWTYNLLSIHPDIDEIIHHLYSVTLDEFWFKERTMVEEGYKDVVHPLQPTYREIVVPEFQMSTRWDLSQLMGYLST